MTTLRGRWAGLHWDPPSPSDLELLGQVQCIVDLNAEVPISALQVTVAEQPLAGARPAPMQTSATPGIRR